MALAVPLVASPASAGLSDGKFFAHAQNIEDAQYAATAGMNGSTIPGGGTGGGTGGEGTLPGGNIANPGGVSDTSAKVATIKSGPMSFIVTQAMLDFSKANVERVARGEAPEVYQGWSFVYHIGGTGIVEGLPEDGSIPEVIALSPDANGQVATITANAQLSGVVSSIDDNRADPRDGLRTMYSSIEGQSDTDGRYVMDHGKLVFVSIESSSSGNAFVKIYTGEKAADRSFLSSSVRPYTFRITNGNIESVSMMLPKTDDGANAVEVAPFAGGLQLTTYRSVSGIYDNGYAQRSNSPLVVSSNADGSIRYAGDSVDGPFYYSVSEYNEKTGKNWDGSVYRLSSNVDTSIPFQVGK